MNFALFGNVIGAEVGMIPGFAFVGPLFGLPVSVLAAFIERPFVSRAGVGREAIWRSLQANLVSLVVGYVLVFLLLPLAMSFGPAAMLAPVAAIAASSFIEFKYLQHQTPLRVDGWFLIAAGNVASGIVCVFIMMFARHCSDFHLYEVMRLNQQINPGLLQTVVAVGCVALFLYSFHATWMVDTAVPRDAETPTDDAAAKSSEPNPQ